MHNKNIDYNDDKAFENTQEYKDKIFRLQSKIDKNYKESVNLYEKKQ